MRDVYEELRLGRRTAYTTVMTTMNNLVRKGLAIQDKGGVAFIYTPAVSDIEVATGVLDVLVDTVMGGCVGPLVEYPRPSKRAAGHRLRQGSRRAA